MPTEDSKRVARALNDARLTRKDFALTPEERAKIKRRDRIEYEASHPEKFPEYNFWVR